MTATVQGDPSVRRATEPWREHWFPVAFTADLEGGILRRVSIHDRGVVLMRKRDGAIKALLDRCPHRAARLSDGRILDDHIECPYHGWQFDGDGRCSRIPQLPPSQPIPATACATAVPIAVRQRMVWIYGGDLPDPDPAAIPHVAAVERDDCHCIDFAIDLPYGQDYLIENVLDFAHVHIAHDGVRGGGFRHLAGPLSFELTDSGPAGFRAVFGAMVDGRRTTGSALDNATVEFAAPNLVHYVSVYKDPRLVSGLALYSVPLSRGRCRLLYRVYSNFPPLRDRLRPRFWEHGYQCHLLEQDMAVVMGQAAELASSQAPPSDLWLPLKCIDPLVLQYRKWLDQHQGGRPDYIGFRSRGPESTAAWETGSIDRLTLHTRQCASCSRALHRARLLERWLAVLAFAVLAAACAMASGGGRVVLAALAAVAYGSSVAAALIARRLSAGGLQSPGIAGREGPGGPSRGG